MYQTGLLFRTSNVQNRYMRKMLRLFALIILLAVAASARAEPYDRLTPPPDIASGPTLGEPRPSSKHRHPSSEKSATATTGVCPGMQVHPDNALQVIRELAPGTSTHPRFTEQGEFEITRRFFRALSLDFERAGIPTPEPSEDFFNYKRDMHDLAISHGLFFVLESFPISEKLRESNIGLFRTRPRFQSSELLSEFFFDGLDHKYSGREEFEVYDVQEVLHPIRSPFLGYTERVPGRGMIVLLFLDEIKLMAKEINVPAEAMRRYILANEFGHVYLNDYFISRRFPERLLGGYTGSVPVIRFPFAKQPLSIIEFHEAFSDLTSAKFGSLEMPSILDAYDHIRSEDLPTVYRFSIAMQNFALLPTVQRFSDSMSKESFPKKGKPFPLAQVSADLRTSPELAPLFFEDYIESLEGRLIPMAVYIANVGSSNAEDWNPAEDHR